MAFSAGRTGRIGVAGLLRSLYGAFTGKTETVDVVFSQIVTVQGIFDTTEAVVGRFRVAESVNGIFDTTESLGGKV